MNSLSKQVHYQNEVIMDTVQSVANEYLGRYKYEALEEYERINQKI